MNIARRIAGERCNCVIYCLQAHVTNCYQLLAHDRYNVPPERNARKTKWLGNEFEHLKAHAPYPVSVREKQIWSGTRFCEEAILSPQIIFIHTRIVTVCLAFEMLQLASFCFVVGVPAFLHLTQRVLLLIRAEKKTHRLETGQETKFDHHHHRSTNSRNEIYTFLLSRTKMKFNKWREEYKWWRRWKRWRSHRQKSAAQKD